MAFVFAYSLNGEPASNIMDFPLDTLSNYQNGTGTNGVTKGDLVFLKTGLVERAGATTTTAPAGVVEGTEFMGLVAQGQPYAATNSSFIASALNTTVYPNGVVKLRVDASSVYEAPLVAGQTATNANLGVAYGIACDANGNQHVDTTNTTDTLVKVVALNPADNTKVFVTLTTNAAAI